MTKPNILFVFGDQWRAQAFGYAGDPNVKTPRIDQFAEQSVNLPNAISGCPVCCPYRASLMTGQYPLTHGIVVNDQSIISQPVSIADALTQAGYNTGYIGKWHIDGRGRSNYIPKERRMGFDYWKVLECTHDYNNSQYYDDDPEPKFWEGYDAIAQTEDACQYISNQSNSEKPFALFLSWGPPHAPYETAPEKYRQMYDEKPIQLRDNVPAEIADHATEQLRGYYAHCTALDDCFGTLLDHLEQLEIADNTIIIFTSDHGDMIGCQGNWKKQWPHEESINVPFLIRWPAGLGTKGRSIETFIDSPDIMPTLLGLANADIPDTVEGMNLAPALRGNDFCSKTSVLLSCYFPFHQLRYDTGGCDYRGLRTNRYTYARNHQGPWLLYDNQNDPYQLNNLVNDETHQELINDLEGELNNKLRDRNDSFEFGWQILRRYNVQMTDDGKDVFYS